MKAVLTIVAMVMFTVAFGSAYADEIPAFNSDRESGYVFSEFAPMHEPALRGTPGVEAQVDFGTVLYKIAITEEVAQVDLGTALYNDAFMTRDAVLAEYGIKGSAAGGMTSEDESTRIWDKLLTPTDGSDWP
jgi:hypothetical protein